MVPFLLKLVNPGCENAGQTVPGDDNLAETAAVLVLGALIEKGGFT
jgi:hypothetical protein